MEGRMSSRPSEVAVNRWYMPEMKFAVVAVIGLAASLIKVSMWSSAFKLAAAE